MKIRKQPTLFNHEQPLLNKILRVYVVTAAGARRSLSGTRSWGGYAFYDSKTRKELDILNWRVKLVKRFGT
jgi:hypothetical protein